MDFSFENFPENIEKAFTERAAISIVDILIVAVLLYILFAFLKKNHAARLIKYLVVFLSVAVALSSSLFASTVTGKLFGYAFVLAVAAIVIIFPQELRRFLYRIASPKESRESFSTNFGCSDEQLHEAVTDIVRAVQNMAKKNVGALIIIATDVVPKHILESGTETDAIISTQLLECIFNTEAPLHDGAVFIRGNRVMASGCFLPLSQSNAIDKELGTRHRAAIGVTEAYNVFAIIVSEETGVISTARAGQISRYYDSVMLTEELEQVFGLRASAEIKNKKKKRK
jgi:diadenylate cyclase